MVIGENRLLSLALGSAEFLPPEGLLQILGPSVNPVLSGLSTNLLFLGEGVAVFARRCFES